MAAVAPLARSTLSDQLARRIRELIHDDQLIVGDRLPPIRELARRFGVGAPTVREGIKRLEAAGLVAPRHGAGVFVTRADDALVVATRDFVGEPTPKLLGDLTRTRVLLETQAARDAATRATAEHLREMRRLLRAAEQSLDNDDVFHAIDDAFHRQLAVASGNAVLAQLLAVLADLFSDERRSAHRAPRAQAHHEHLGILAALEQCAPELVAERVAAHLTAP